MPPHSCPDAVFPAKHRPFPRAKSPRTDRARALDAEQLIKDLDGKGKVAILEGISGAPSAVDRQEWFVEKIEILRPKGDFYNNPEDADIGY